jgi:hypothetical protein
MAEGMGPFFFHLSVGISASIPEGLILEQLCYLPQWNRKERGDRALGGELRRWQERKP